MAPHLVWMCRVMATGTPRYTLPILNALRRSLPKLKLTIRTSVPAAWLAERLEGECNYIDQSDFGMAMVNSLHAAE